MSADDFNLFAHLQGRAFAVFYEEDVEVQVSPLASSVANDFQSASFVLNGGNGHQSSPIVFSQFIGYITWNDARSLLIFAWLCESRTPDIGFLKMSAFSS